MPKLKFLFAQILSSFLYFLFFFFTLLLKVGKKIKKTPRVLRIFFQKAKSWVLIQYRKIPHKPWWFLWLFFSALAEIAYLNLLGEAVVISLLELNVQEAVFLSLGAGLVITFPLIDEKIKGLWFIFMVLILAINISMLFKAFLLLTFFIAAPLLAGGVMLTPFLVLTWLAKELFK